MTAIGLGIAVAGAALLVALLVERLAHLRGGRAARRAAAAERASVARLERRAATDHARRQLDLHVTPTPTGGENDE